MVFLPSFSSLSFFPCELLFHLFLFSLLFSILLSFWSYIDPAISVCVIAPAISVSVIAPAISVCVIAPAISVYVIAPAFSVCIELQSLVSSVFCLFRPLVFPLLFLSSFYILSSVLFFIS
jgi:hypothetical protein